MNEGNGAVLEVAALAKADDGTVELQAIEVDAGPTGGSHQAPDEADLWTPDDTLAPPEDLESLKRLSENSQPREDALRALVRNTVGLGWDLTVWEGHEQESDPDEIRAARMKLDLFARRDRRLDRPSFSTLISAVKRDQKEVGQGYIEVSRNRRTGEVNGLYHVPGERVRRKRDKSGWVMGQNAQLAGSEAFRVDFYNFGEKVAYDDQGRPQPRLSKTATRWITNELIPLREYSSQSRDYGLPADLGLAVEYAAARFCQEWTAGFFQSGGVPPHLVFVQGQETRQPGSARIKFTVPTKTVNRIDQALRSDARPGNRVVLIPVPPGTQVDDVSLGELSDRDLTFGEFKKMHSRHVGAAFGLLPLFYGDVDDAGRYTAEVQRSMTLEQTFDPDQRETEDKLGTTLLVDLGLGHLRFKFKRLAVEGDAVKRESANTGAEVGAILVGEWRKAHGYGPLPWDGQGPNPNDEILNVGQPRGAQDRVGVAATEDQRGLRPGIGGRTAKSGEEPDDHGHGEPHVEEEVEELAKELAEYVPADQDDE